MITPVQVEALEARIAVMEDQLGKLMEANAASEQRAMVAETQLANANTVIAKMQQNTAQVRAQPVVDTKLIQENELQTSYYMLITAIPPLCLDAKAVVRDASQGVHPGHLHLGVQ